MNDQICIHSNEVKHDNVTGYSFQILIWYDFILFAQNRGPKAELLSTIWEEKEKTQYDQKQS